ncbi:MAG: hypothetical protein EPO32_11090 [Anaerolineae bacterium]|nr:MAG: hypothetical protein EPO32_11090 [Anaerolineae bacterium]
MTILWFIVGILVGVGGYALWQAKGAQLKGLDWTFLVLWLVLALLTIATVGSLATEPFIRHSQAASVAGLIFGGLTVLTGVLLVRRVAALK